MHPPGTAGATTGYHHVILSDCSAVYPTNAAPPVGDNASRSCLTCHVDHDYFNKTVNPSFVRAKNLRRDIADAGLGGQTAALSDYDNSLGNGGICTSCHVNLQSKSTTNLKNDNTTSTPVVSKGSFNASAHNYGSLSPYVQGHFTGDNGSAASYFRMNCGKCHNDTLGTQYQNGSYRFGLHASSDNDAVDKLLAPLGSTATEFPGELFCYRCHSHLSDGLSGTKKSRDGYDWYDNQAMSAKAEQVYGVVSPSNPLGRGFRFAIHRARYSM